MEIDSNSPSKPLECVAIAQPPTTPKVRDMSGYESDEEEEDNTTLTSSESDSAPIQEQIRLNNNKNNNSVDVSSETMVMDTDTPSNSSKNNNDKRVGSASVEGEEDAPTLQKEHRDKHHHDHRSHHPHESNHLHKKQRGSSSNDDQNPIPPSKRLQDIIHESTLIANNNAKTDSGYESESEEEEDVMAKENESYRHPPPLQLERLTS